MSTFTRLLAACLAVVGLSVPADAASAVRPGSCESRGYVAGYAEVGDDLAELPIEWDNTIHEHLCVSARGIRYVKAVGNTPEEYDELERNAVGDSTETWPVVLCGDRSGRSHMVDLAYYYFSSVKAPSRLERASYARWAARYADRRGCAIYDGSQA